MLVIRLAMANQIPPPTSFDGSALIKMPLSEDRSWLKEGKIRDFGVQKDGLCSCNLYKTRDNRLYVFLRVITWGDRFIKEHIRWYAPPEGADVSILHIRWRDKGVNLRQDNHPSIEVGWQLPE